MNFQLEVNSAEESTIKDVSCQDIENALNKIITDGDFLILTPQSPIDSCEFMQVQFFEGAYSCEIKIVYEDAEKIWAKDIKSRAYVIKILCSFLTNILPDYTDWQVVRQRNNFYTPKELFLIMEQNGLIPLSATIEKNSCEIVLNDGVLSFMNFVKKSGIKHIFYWYDFSDINNYVIDIEKAKDKFDEYYDKVEKDILNQNKLVQEIDFNNPTQMCVFCLYQGIIVRTAIIKSDTLNSLNTSEIFMNQLQDKYAEVFDEIANREKEEIKALKDELISYILSDQDFDLRTNQALRKDYIFKLLDVPEYTKYKRIFHRNTYLSNSNYDYNLVTFIDYVWGIKKNKKFSSIIDWSK